MERISSVNKFNLNKLFKGNENFIKLKKILFSKSHIGTRSKNEDYAYSGLNKLLDNLLIVCDGVGSCRGSYMAAEIVSKTFIKSFLNQEYLLTSSINEWFETNILKAKAAMKEHVLKFNDDLQMCTTLVLTLTVEDNVHVFWIGDSRAYLITKKGIEMISEDHNLLNYLISIDASKDEIEKQGPNIYSLTNCITISTSEKQKYDYVTFKIKKNSFIFLASDGFYNWYGADNFNQLYDVLSALDGDTNTENISNNLVSTAMIRKSNDNISFSCLGFLKK